ncbi:alpha/beta hydrolase [Streptomyces venezuelae]|uniref:Alpha/beta hydrolase n=1 Tax=Streptomyces venezuelae TaxID=54571 RepID=A0A5P2DBC2_STRVZ|nr:alpha/beta hydrolase [Streptomyces venezuelae]QES52464.1 alpha/beta hydrolase [Streptomyces venezuelae]
MMKNNLVRGAAAVVLAAVLGSLAVPVAAAAGPGPAPGPGPGWKPAVEATAAPQAAPRGTLLRVTPVAALGRDQVRAYEAESGVDTATVRYGVRAYRIEYATVTPEGRPTTATGLLTLPEGGPRRPDLVSDTHGTLAYRDGAPSGPLGWNRLTPYLHASAGRAVAAPDYLGLGGGPGPHPYLDTRSAVTASHDMLRAARTASGRLGRPLSRDVYVTGFSQGGQVAMALGRELSRPGSGFRLRALAPMAGPYDLAGQMTALTDGRTDPRSAVFYLSYFLTAQNRLHPLYRDPAEVFREPYAQRVAGLFDGSRSEEEIVAALPGTLDELLTPAWAELVRRPEGALLSVLRANSGVCDWRPGVPVRLYAAAGDRDVPIGHARACAAELAGNGVRARLVDQGPAADHNGTAIRSLGEVARWFDALSRP